MSHPPSLSNIRSVFFDLDGTLADTAADLAFALNTLLEQESKPPLPFETIRPVVSHGGIALIKLGFQIEPDQTPFEELRNRLLTIYRQHIAQSTQLFPGMSELLNKLERHDINWGIVTNKPGWLTDPLMQALSLTDRAVTIISGDTTKNRKPHPEPLLLACKHANQIPNQCIYIGDAQRDIEAGNRAGMRTLVALFGYLSEHDDPTHWGADAMVNHPSEVWHWIAHW